MSLYLNYSLEKDGRISFRLCAKLRKSRPMLVQTASIRRNFRRQPQAGFPRRFLRLSYLSGMVCRIMAFGKAPTNPLIPKPEEAVGLFGAYLNFRIRPALPRLPENVFRLPGPFKLQ
jgi:hypothetical protein